MNEFEKLKEQYSKELMKLSPSAPTTSESQATGEPSKPADNTDKENIGYMQVRVTALGGSVPIIKANVTVEASAEGENRVMLTDVTDQNGKTSVLNLPTPSASLSQAPNQSVVPYAVYNVTVTAPGFYTVYNVNSQVFENVLSIVSVDMVPKKESELFGEGDMTFVTPESELLNT